MTIKVSAFPDAATPMAVADRVTGVQGGVNVNFSQAQIFSTPNGVLGGAGGTIAGHLGAGNGSGTGGNFYLYGGSGGDTGGGSILGLYGGNGGATSGDGGNLRFVAGSAIGVGVGGNVTIRAGGNVGTGDGGRLELSGGVATDNGGDLTIVAGDTIAAAEANKKGGNITIYAGNATNTGNTAGNFTMGPGTPGAGATSGWLYFKNIPVQATDAGIPSGAAWINSATRVLTISP